MNGIAMQSFASEFVADTTTSTTTPKERFLETWSIATTITAGQLLLGALLGRVLLYGIDKTIRWNDIKESHEARLSALHAFGSLATNIGFMYGKASLIQVIKLLGEYRFPRAGFHWVVPLRCLRTIFYCSSAFNIIW